MQRWVYAASLLVVLVLPVPLQWLLFTTGAVTHPGGLPILGQLIAWMLVAAATSESFAGRYAEVVYGVAVLLYIAPYVVLSVPVDVLTQARPRLRIAALSVIAVGYVLVVWFAFPVSGVPI